MSVTSKQILRKVKAWENNPVWTLGVYRLFIYLPWEEIPKKYRDSKEFKGAFKKEVIDTWNDNINVLTEGLEYDMGEYIKVIFLNVLSRQIVRAFGLMPVIYADLFMLGNKVDGKLGPLSKSIKEYISYIQKDRVLAETTAMNNLSLELLEIIKKHKIPTKYDPESIVERVQTEIRRILKSNTPTATIMQQVDEALEAHEKAEASKNG